MLRTFQALKPKQLKTQLGRVVFVIESRCSYKKRVVMIFRDTLIDNKIECGKNW